MEYFHPVAERQVLLTPDAFSTFLSSFNELPLAVER